MLFKSLKRTRSILALLATLHLVVLSIPSPAQATSSEPWQNQVTKSFSSPQGQTKIQYVSLENFEKLKLKYSGQSVLVTANSSASPHLTESNSGKEAPITHPDQVNPCLRQTEFSSSPETHRDDSFFFVNWTQNTQFNDGKDVLIFFAVIGVVAVAALVVYSASFLWKAASAGFECRVWSQSGLRFSYISDRSDTQVRRGTMSGAFYSLGYKIPHMTMSLTAEAGHLDMDLEVKSTGESQKFDGAYLLVGPSFDIPISDLGHSFQIELLAGTATEKNIGAISTLRFGFDFRVSPRFRFGISFGAALIDVKTFEGVLADIDQINYLSGVTTGYRF